MKEDDLIFTNVEVSFDGSRTELDNIVVNENGVFIIEVKNYSGSLQGNEDDFEWIKTKIRGANVYVKRVKNPIRQVKRQVYLLANHLRENGARVWVDGYVIILNSRSPVKSEYVLTSISAINQTIHTPGKRKLTRSEIETIRQIFGR